jgi:hypothetical protein
MLFKWIPYVQLEQAASLSFETDWIPRVRWRKFMVLWRCAHAQGHDRRPNAFLVTSSSRRRKQCRFRKRAEWDPSVYQAKSINFSNTATPETLDRVVENQSSRVCSYGRRSASGQPSLPILQVHLYIDAGEPPSASSQQATIQCSCSIVSFIASASWADLS